MQLDNFLWDLTFNFKSSAFVELVETERFTGHNKNLILHEANLFLYV